MLKFLGGIFLMIGSMVGGGILAIPLISANFGFITAVCFLVLAWAVMTKTGLYVLELSLSCKERYNSYYTIVGKFLGEKVQAISMILFLWLLYFSLSSYISGCVSVLLSFLSQNSQTHSYFNLSFLFVLLFGSFIVVSSRIVVRLNGVIVAVKLILLMAVIFLSHQFYKPFSLSDFVILKKGLLTLSLIILNAFGFQFIIPSLVTYYGRENHLIFKKMLVASTSLVFLLYLLWTFAIYSIIPRVGTHGLESVFNSSNQLIAFNDSLSYFIDSVWVRDILSVFEGVALFGSFLCVSLGLFDYLVDLFKADNRFLIAIATFTPPLLLTLLSQNMYLYAMSGAGYIAVILEIIIPICAIRSLKNPTP